VTYLPNEFFDSAADIPYNPDDPSVVNPDFFKTK
jgi:hypothetical protein